MEDYVTFELARKLKEKGYPQKTLGNYDMIGACYYDDGKFYKEGYIALVEDCFTAPTIEQVLKWLREEKKIHIVIDSFLFNDNTEILWVFMVRDIQNDSIYEIFEDCRRNTFDEAALAGIEYVLDNLI